MWSRFPSSFRANLKATSLIFILLPTLESRRSARRSGEKARTAIPSSWFPLFLLFDVVSRAGRYFHHQERRRSASCAARSVRSVHPDPAFPNSDSLPVSRTDGPLASCDVACSDVQRGSDERSTGGCAWVHPEGGQADGGGHRGRAGVIDGKNGFLE